MYFVRETLLMVWLVSSVVDALPTPQMCAAFAKFAEKWNPLPETLLAWVKNPDNCAKIQPRPADMTCEDVEQFVADCNYGGGGPRGSQEQLQLSNRELTEKYYQEALANRPQVLPKYVHANRQTAYDYGQFGNWYYPNFYPWAYVNDFDGTARSLYNLENDYKFAQGGHYPYHRADNMINIALQQTSLPTCLHDLFYCVRASIAASRQRTEAAQKAQSEAMHASDRDGHERRLKRSLRFLLKVGAKRRQRSNLAYVF